MSAENADFTRFGERAEGLTAEQALGHYIVWVNLARGHLQEGDYEAAETKLLEVVTAMTKLDNENRGSPTFWARRHQAEG